ncbi:hypothetical protein KEM48_011228 [Puccinia striiformis f. sp. tritici PST-130]|nr:hypothetical protein KEM48_011228 [Puccinia striiformis f. sp. tritici PST-130]
MPKRNRLAKLHQGPELLLVKQKSKNLYPRTSKTSSKTEIVVEPAPANDENIVPTPPTPENSQLSLDAEGKKEQGNLLFKAGKFTEAIASYSEAIRLNSDNPAYLANRAAALMSIRNYSSALVDMQLVISPKFIALGHQPTPKNIVRLVRCYLPLGQFYQAKQALKNLLEQSPSYRDRKDWSMLLIGLDRLQKELDCGPLKAKEWLIWKVEALCGQKKWDDAKCICNELVRSSPSDPEGLYYRAKVMYSQGNLSATVSHCQEAMRCDPDFASARTLLRQARNIESLKEAGNVSFKATDYKTAIQKYIEAGSIDPSNESLVLTLDSNRAQALLKSELYTELSNDEIKKAFRRQSLIHHPDKGGNEEKFKTINNELFLLYYVTVDPDNPTGGMSDFYSGFEHDDGGDQMPFGFEGCK